MHIESYRILENRIKTLATMKATSTNFYLFEKRSKKLHLLGVDYSTLCYDHITS